MTMPEVIDCPPEEGVAEPCPQEDPIRYSLDS